MRGLRQIIIVTIVKTETVRVFGEEHWESMRNIITRESGFNPYSVNSSSGACGLFQFYPCGKLKCELSDVACQARAGIEYVKNRYISPISAWIFWQTNNYY